MRELSSRRRFLKQAAIAGGRALLGTVSLKQTSRGIWREPSVLAPNPTVIFHVHFIQAGHHFALAITDARHINRDALVMDAKLFASAKIRHDLRAVDDVFARQARNIRG
jgi:hypothetical protein